VGAAATGLVTVVIAETLGRTRRMTSDAAIGLTFPALFSAGILLLDLYGRDVHVDADTVLLGEIGFVWLDVVTVAGTDVPAALLRMAVVAALNVAFVVTFFSRLKLATFDPALAAVLGLAPGVLGYVLLGLTSVTAVASLDAVGVVLFVAFAIVPPATAYLLTDDLARMLWLSGCVAVASSVLGYPVAVALDVNVGAAMACVAGLFLLAAFVGSPRHGVLARSLKRRSQLDANENRALAVHLFTHESGPEARDENVRAALVTHLRWSTVKARAVVARSLDAGLVERQGEMLALTAKGRHEAEQVLTRRV
jgi:manganese/zinc/iron transport system permease protein